MKNRQPFKRLVVLSYENRRDASLVEQLHKFYRQNADSWEVKLDFQRDFQDRIVKAVAAAPIVSESRNVTEAVRLAFLAEAKDQVVLLVDVPPERRAASKPLSFIAEEDRASYKADKVEAGAFLESTLWKSLQNDFAESLGKVRVFGLKGEHNYHWFVRDLLGHDKIVELLNHSLVEGRK